MELLRILLWGLYWGLLFSATPVCDYVIWASRLAYIVLARLATDTTAAYSSRAWWEKQKNPLNSRSQSRAQPIVYPTSKATAEAEQAVVEIKSASSSVRLTAQQKRKHLHYPSVSGPFAGTSSRVGLEQSSCG